MFPIKYSTLLRANVEPNQGMVLLRKYSRRYAIHNTRWCTLV